MAKFIVKGGKSLEGEIEVKGSKNEAFQVICASLLTDEPITLRNVPDILDANKLLELLRLLGSKIEKIGAGEVRITTQDINQKVFNDPKFIQLVSSIRGSVLLAAPLLARINKVSIPKPGGDKIGRRHIDVHLNALLKMGIKINFDRKKDFYQLSTDQLIGADICLEEASVTGTANIIMASVTAKGKTQIYNAASEPYIYQLCSMLNNMGAKINGHGTNKIIIEGVKKLKSTDHNIAPDIMEVGTFIGLAASTKSDLKIKNVPIEFISPIIQNFEKLGIKIKIGDNMLHIPKQDIFTIRETFDGGIINISDNIWPGFPADLISIIIVTAIQARGNILVRQRMFESRLFFVDNLIEMGAKIILCDPHRVVVIGLENKSKLRPKTINSPDIRAGLALLIAALSADGTSIIENISQIDRGYENIEHRLRNLGADIERIE